MPDLQNKDVSLLRLKEPVFLSLVKHPANRTSFKVVRSEKEGLGDIVHRIRTRKAQRADGSLLSITLPSGTTQEEANSIVDIFALGDEYVLEVGATGEFFLRKAHNIGDSDIIEMDIGNGFMAQIDQAAFVARADTTISGVTVTSIRFEEDIWDSGKQSTWLKDKEIPFEGSLQKNSVIKRHSVPEDIETKEIEIEKGVFATIARSEGTDIPKRIYRSVIEIAYGQFGYGHLDFIQSIADEKFSYDSEEAIYTLQNILDNILLYSLLPLDERKILVKNALESFNLYVSSLIDALPAEVVRQARADRKIQQEADKMAGETKDTEQEIKRSDTPEVKTTEEGATTEQVTRSDETDVSVNYVTREDMAKAVTEAVTAAMEGYQTETAKRSEESEKGLTETLTTIKDTVVGVKESLDTVTRSIGKLQSEVDEIGGSTVTHETEDEASTLTEEQVKQRSDDGPFGGMFGDRFDGLNPSR